jgi:hypothetical protein
VLPVRARHLVAPPSTPMKIGSLMNSDSELSKSFDASSPLLKITALNPMQKQFSLSGTTSIEQFSDKNGCA